jgi:hypothetical protein
VIDIEKHRGEEATDLGKVESVLFDVEKASPDSAHDRCNLGKMLSSRATVRGSTEKDES